MHNVKYNLIKFQIHSVTTMICTASRNFYFAQDYNEQNWIFLIYMRADLPLYHKRNVKKT